MIRNISSILDISVKGYTIIIAALVLFTCLIAINYGVDNLEMVATFETDEYRMAEMLLDDVNDGQVDPDGFYHYGNAHNVFMFHLASALKNLNFNINERFIIVLARLFSFFPLLMSIFLVYKLTLLFSGDHKIISYVAAFCFAVMPVSAYWGATIHPDMIQLTLFLLALYALFRIKSDLRFFVAAFFAGLAAGTLYQPLAVIPILAAYAIYCQFHKNTGLLKKILFSLLYLLAIIAVATAAFFLVNITAIEHFDLMQKAFDAIQLRIKVGFGDDRETGFDIWAALINKQLGDPFYYLVIVGYLYYVGYFIRHLVNSLKEKKYLPFSRIDNDLMFMAGVSLFYFIHHSIRVHQVFPRYILLALPLFIIVGLCGFFRLVQLLFTLLPESKGKQAMPQAEQLSIDGDKNENKFVPIAVSAILLILLLASFSQHLSAIKKSSERSYRYNHYALVADTHWQEIISENDFVYTDRYTYLSKKPKVRYQAYTISREVLDNFQPDVIILSSKGSGRMCWKKPGTKMADHDYIISKGWDSEGKMVELFNYFTSRESNWIVAYENDYFIALKKRKDREIVKQGDTRDPLYVCFREISRARNFVDSNDTLPEPTGKVATLKLHGATISSQGQLPGFESDVQHLYSLSADKKSYQLVFKLGQQCLITGNYLPGNSEVPSLITISDDGFESGQAEIDVSEKGQYKFIISGPALYNEIYRAEKIFTGSKIVSPGAAVNFNQNVDINIAEPGKIDRQVNSYNDLKGYLVNDQGHAINLGENLQLSDFTLSCWVYFPTQPVEIPTEPEKMTFLELMGADDDLLAIVYSEERTTHFQRKVFGFWKNGSPARRKTNTLKEKTDLAGWHLITITRIGNGLNLYLDGLPEDRTTIDDRLILEAAAFLPRSTSIPFAVAQMELYEKAFDAETIYNLFYLQAQNYYR